MEKRNGNNLMLKAFFGAVLAMLLSLALLLMANAAMPFRQLAPQGDSPLPPQDAPNPLINPFLMQVIVSFSMLILSFYLFFIYLKDYLELGSSFTLGLLLAIFSFMLFAVAANPLLHVFFGVYGKGGVIQLMPYLFSTLSLAILVYVSSK